MRENTEYIYILFQTVRPPELFSNMFHRSEPLCIDTLTQV